MALIFKTHSTMRIILIYYSTIGVITVTRNENFTHSQVSLLPNPLSWNIWLTLELRRSRFSMWGKCGVWEAGNCLLTD